MPSSDPSDADDVRLSLEGDHEAFGRLYDRYSRLVRSVVLAVSGDFDAVEDLTQETFLRAYSRLNTLRDPNGFRSWIQGIARMVAREWRRSIMRKRRELETGGNEHMRETAYELHDAAEGDELLQRAMSAMAELSERERLAVHAHFFHEQNGDDAARSIGMSRSGFYAALKRGMARLRKRLGVATKSPTSGEHDES